MRSVELSAIDDVVVASISVDLDIGNADTVGEVIRDGVPNTAAGLIVDLARVRYLDSAGIAMLFGLIRSLEACRQRVAIALPPDAPVRKLLKISHLDEVAYVCASHVDCLAGLRERLTGGL